jgi:putative copper resistance protein D
MLLALMRGLFVAGALSSFGASLFTKFILLPVAGEFGAEPSKMVSRRLRAIMAGSLGVALLAGISWLILQTREMAETQSFAETASAVPSVLFGTRFGQVLCLQAAALTGAAILVAANARFTALAAILAGLAVVLEAGHSHAFAMAHGLNLLLLAQALHLLAVGAWLGELLPLLAVVRRAPLEVSQRVLKRFSPTAAVSVAILAATALLQGAVLSGGLKGLFGTAYGAVLLLKLAFFAALIALAANNRLRLTPALASRDGEATRRSLALSIGIETAIGLLVVLAAAALSGLEPGMHITSG